MGKNNTLFYHAWLDVFEDFSPAEIGELTVAILTYDKTGELPEFSDRALAIAFKSIKTQIDANNEAYQERCKANQKAAKARWDANACERMQTHANASSCMHTDAQNADRVTVTDRVTDKKDSYSGSFVTSDNAQLRETVKAYFAEKGFISDPDAFVDYNIGRGNDVIFKNANRWQAVANRWEKKEKDMHPPDRFELLDKIIAGEVTYDDVSGSS